MEPEVFCRWCGQKMSLVMHKDQDGYWGQYMCKCGASARWGNKHKKKRYRYAARVCGGESASASATFLG